MKTYKLLKQSAVALVLVGLGVSTTSVFAADGGVYESNGSVEFIPSTDPVSPVDPENPDPENPVTPIDPTDPTGPNPGTAGPLSIDYASSLDFGKNKITNKDQTYFAKAQGFSEGAIKDEFRGNYVQVTDNRGTNAGWTLSLKQEGQFTSATAKQYKELTGAKITLADSVADSESVGVAAPTVTNVTLDPSGASTVIMAAKTGDGAGTWVDRFGQAEEMTIDGENVQKNKAVTLEIPGKTPKEAAQYTTKLTWTLTDVPGN
ncbi:Cell surface protein [Carnobacterium maltaromaticum]|uniref:WxL domain-containing protein n=1 Tax=Carnobacterium maltaromaticum TaxID=2751 RepID=UPI00191BC3F3|nr:WxL domain-containing protein [Carnobacterium maltaromaticum]CAD5896740.1 Cell surface protein [Carnobacterium maltaromaticum]